VPLLSEELFLAEALLLSEDDDVTSDPAKIPPARLAFILEDLDTGQELDDLATASGKQVVLSQGATPGTATFTLRLSNSLAPFLRAGRSALAVYELDPILDLNSRRLIFHGRQTGTDIVANEQGRGLAVIYSDPSWFLSRRFVGKSSAGYSRGTALAPVGREVIVRELLNALNLEGTTRLAVGAMQPSGTTYVAGWAYKLAMDALTELTTGADAPEWRCRPIAWTAGYLAALDIGPQLGQARPDAVFAYGDDELNLAAFEHVGTLDGAANSVYVLPQSADDSAVARVQHARNDASLATTELLEDVLTTDLTAEPLMLQLGTDHVQVRGGLRETVTPTVARDLGDDRIPRLGTDYDVGDIVRLNVSYPLDDGTIERALDAWVRVYAVQLDVDPEGGVTVTPTFTPNAIGTTLASA
jgi:hypothetical protein